MVYALHKFKHFLLGNKFVFNVNHNGYGVLGQQTIGVKNDNKMVVVIFGI
jgi:hypothetical protein